MQQSLPCFYPPLTSAMAAAVRDVLLCQQEEDRDCSVKLLAEHLRHDPSFVAFVVRQRWYQSKTSSCSVEGVARWFLSHDIDLLERMAAAPPTQIIEPQKWQTLCAHYAATALAARQLATAEGTSATGAAELAALVDICDPENELSRLLADDSAAANESATDRAETSDPGKVQEERKQQEIESSWNLLAIDSSQPEELRKLLRRAKAAVSEANDSSLADLGEIERAAEVTRQRCLSLASQRERKQLLQLAMAMQRLNQLEKTFAETLQHEKLESLKELAYGAGHEINNPLANISVQAQTLLRDEQQPERRRRLAAMNNQAFRAHEMIADLMLFSRPPKLSWQTVHVSDLLSRLVTELRSRATEQGTEIVGPQSSLPLEIEADPVQLEVALRGLCANALEALGAGGKLTIDLQEDDAVEPMIQIIIADDGPGISAEVKRHIFDPFYSGREAGRGLGFGLSKAWRIITDHGGQIAVHSQAGQGAEFTVSLPKKRASSR